MRRVLGCVFGLALACQTAPAVSREPLRLKPVEPWNLHYAEDSCRLARTFATGDEQVILVLDQFEPGDWFRVMFVGDVLPGSLDGIPKGSVRFGPNEDASETSVMAGKMGSKRALIVSKTLRIAPLTQAERRQSISAPIGEAREAAVMWLELKRVKRDLVLETGPMAKPLGGLRECSWATVKTWGLDVEQQKKLAKRPEPKRSPTEWLSSSDYPNRMVREGQQGIVNFRMIIDAAGKPTSCHIQESTRPKEFDDGVCEVAMKRATFSPAIDDQGRPVPSYWRETVRFVLPE